MILRINVRFLLPAMLACLAAPSLEAQTGATTGIIRGTITDPTGGPIEDARVTVRQQETMLQRSVTTNGSGVFVIPLLPTGLYDVVVESVSSLRDIRRDDVVVRLGEAVDLNLSVETIQLEGIQVTLGGAPPLVDPSDVTSSTRLGSDVFSGVPNLNRNFLDLMVLTPGAGIVQSPDGDLISLNGQRGVFNNLSVDGADFNNPFFGGNRGGQRPAFTFNQDAIEEMVVVNQGATAEYGRSAGGFVNVITKSGRNEVFGTAHYFGQSDALATDFARGGGKPDFSQHQFGFTLGGPLRRDKAFYFIAYDQQESSETKQVTRAIRDPEALDRLESFLVQRYGTAFENEFGPIERTDDARAFIAKVDLQTTDQSSLSLKYNYFWAEQLNGTFDVDAWGRSANAIEGMRSHALNGALHSQVSSSVSNEFRFQLARESRPRPYSGPTLPGTDRPFPDTGAEFVDGFRWGQPFFIPVDAHYDRIQALNNTSISVGQHLVKFGAEWNHTRSTQTFVGFGNGRFIFSSVDGFMNYVDQGPTYVECSDGSSSVSGQCPEGTEITGPLLFFLQFAPVAAGTTVEEAGTQTLVQNELAAYVQDTWRPNRELTLNFGLRWEAAIQPDVITPVEEVFYRRFIGSPGFPSDGTIQSQLYNVQPRLGLTWDFGGEGRRVIRANAGLYNARMPSLTFASIRTTNGNIGQTIFRSSAFNGFGVTPPAYGELLNTAGITPVRPNVFIMDRDFQLPRTVSATLSYGRMLGESLAAEVSYNMARGDNLFRFVNRNDPVFGSPFSEFPDDPSNGLGQVNSMESTARSRYHGLTATLRGRFTDRVRFETNYTLSWDRSDDDNERQVFVYRYARADRLEEEFGWSDRDQRHRFNAWLLAELPGGVSMSHRISAYSAQPISESCGGGNTGTGEPSSVPADRICPDGSILPRNTLRKDNAFFSWDVRASRPFPVGGAGDLELVLEVFNLFNSDNFRDPSRVAPLFNFDGAIQSGLGDPFRLQVGARWMFGGTER